MRDKPNAFAPAIVWLLLLIPLIAIGIAYERERLVILFGVFGLIAVQWLAVLIALVALASVVALIKDWKNLNTERTSRVVFVIIIVAAAILSVRVTTGWPR